MAAKTLLNSVESIINGASFAIIVRESFGPVSTAEASECSSKATQALVDIQELVSNDGITIASLKKIEVKAFIKDAPTAAAGSFSAAEYHALLETLTKYAALKARHNNGKRWGLGLTLSTAGAMALTAAVFTSTGLLLVAAPAGAAIGAVAVAADGSKARRQDRRTAKKGSTSSSSAVHTPAPAAETQEAPAAAAEAPLGPEDVQITPISTTEAPEGAEEAADIVPVPVPAFDAEAAVPTTEAVAPTAEVAALAEERPAGPAAAVVLPEASAAAAVASPAVPAPAAPVPASVASSGNSSPRGSSDELVSAVVDFMPAAAATADAPKDTAAADNDRAVPTIDAEAVADDDVPAPVQCESPFADASKSTGAADADLLPPAALAMKTAVATEAAAGAGATAGSAGLPPKPKKSKSLTKSMSKKLKKAFSLKDTASKDTGAHKALDADSDSPLAPPVPPPRKSNSFFRRSSDSFMRRSSDGGSGSPSFFRRNSSDGNSSSFFRRSSSDMGEMESVDGVEKSKGSATIKKMVEGIRRSFSLERNSLDLAVQPKKARKAQ